MRTWLRVLAACLVLLGLHALWWAHWAQPERTRTLQAQQQAQAQQLLVLLELQGLLKGMSENAYRPASPAAWDQWRRDWLHAQTLSEKWVPAAWPQGVHAGAAQGLEQAFAHWHKAVGTGLQRANLGAADWLALREAQQRWAPALLSDTQRLTQALAQGPAAEPASTLDTLGLLALPGALLLVAMTAIFGMGQTLRRQLGTEPSRLVRITHAIVQGNLNPGLPERTPSQGSAIANIALMLENLRANQDVNQHRLWLDKGLALVNDTVRNEYTINELAKKISEILTIYLELQACALYLYAFGAEDDSMIQRKALRLYGFHSRDAGLFPARLQHGLKELQAAAPLGRLLRTRDLPPELLAELSGPGAAAEAQFMMVPLQFENDIRGTLVFKSRQALPAHLSDLMAPASVAIGVAVESALNRETLMASLMDAQRLTNQLQVNHEKLQDSQSALQEKIHYVNDILSSMHSGLLIVDQQGKIVDCNPALQNMTGMRREQLIGLHSGHLFEENETSLLSILKSQGQMLTRLGLQDAQAYHELIAGSLLGSLLVDAQGRILEANGRAAQITGYSTAELAMLQVGDLVPLRHRRAHSEIVPLAMQDESLHRAGLGRQLPLLRKDHEEVQVEISLINHQFEGQPVTLALLRGEHDLPWAVINSSTLQQLVSLEEDAMVTQLRHAEGHNTPVRITSSFMLDASGMPQHTVINVDDVSSLIHKSKQIRAQHQLLEMTMDAMQDGVLRVDRQGQLVSANPMALSLLGLDKARVLSAKITELFPGSQNERSLSYWLAFGFEQLMARLVHEVQQAPESAHKLPVPLLMLDAQGRLQWATPSGCELLGLHPAPQDQGEPVALAPETSEQLQTLRANLPAHSEEPCIVDVAWKAGDAPTMRLPTLIIGGQGLPEQQMLVWLIPEFDALCAHTIGQLHNVEWRILQPEGMLIPVLLTASPLLDPYGRLTGAVLTIKDMREIKEKEAENLRMVQKMEQSQKLDALGQLAAGVAHDFNNLLGVIQNHAELVEMKIGPDTKAAKNLSAILQATTRARDIVIKLNGLGREQKQDEAEENLGQFELLPLINETQSLLQASLKGIEIDVAAPEPGLGTVLLRGQSGALQQVVVNLCVNASHAIGDRRDGRILIETLCPSEKLVHVDVVDNGSGIPPEILPRIFEPFFTTKEVGKGTGLGLAMVRSIVTKMGGTIECLSELGKGTRFSIRLPCERQG